MTGRNQQLPTIQAPKLEPNVSTLDMYPKGQGPAVNAYLLLFEGDSARRIALPSDGEVTIGRGEGCEVPLQELRVSRAHARVILEAGRARLIDLGSQNGTRLNDEAVTGANPLAAGDVISIGTATLVFHTSSRASVLTSVLEPTAFHSRAGAEVERARRFGRPLSVVSFSLSHQTTATDVLEMLAKNGSHFDVSGWLGPGHLAVLLPEIDAEGARELAEDFLEGFPEGRAGIAECPNDALDADTLFAAARAAAEGAPPGAVALASAAHRTLALGEHTVLIADPAMQRLYQLAERLAASELSVLVCGETGGGKELVANAIHHFSPRRAERLVAVNCAALSESLLESELFGHEKGAFTGAVNAKEGLLESARGGTVFLDEVGEMSLALQSKLLRVLETRRLTRVGDTREREVDMRIVAATHRDLGEEVKAMRFRQDLFFRLAGATLWLPPLRARPRELPLLARTFLEEASKRSGKETPVLAPGALERLAAHAWPGNVRELRNVMEYLAATVLDGVVESWHVTARLEGQDAQGATAKSSATAPPGQFRAIADEIRELEQRRMLEALDLCEWNQTRAAAAIQMPLRTFVTRFKQLDLGARRNDR